MSKFVCLFDTCCKQRKNAFCLLKVDSKTFVTEKEKNMGRFKKHAFISKTGIVESCMISYAMFRTGVFAIPYYIANDNNCSPCLENETI